MVVRQLLWVFSGGKRFERLVLLLAFLVTAAILFVGMPAFQGYATYRYSLGFADGYNLIAKNLADGNGYRWRPDMDETMVREPGYPLLLAAAFKIGGYRIEAARFLNLLLTVGIAVMLLALARKITVDPRIPIIAALLFLLHPGTWIAEARGGVEILFIFVGFAFLLTLHRAMEKGGFWRYLLAGLAFGVVVQVRSTPIVFPVFLLLYFMFTARGARRRLAAAWNVAIVVAGMGLIMAPWVVRNYQLVHEFVPFATIRGLAAQEGLYICRNVPFGVDDYSVVRQAGRIRGELARALSLRFEGAEYLQMFYDAHDEVAFNSILYETARNEYVRDPGLWMECVGRNLFNFWFLGKTWRVTTLNMLVQGPALALVLYGLAIVRRRGELRAMGILVAYVVSIAIAHLLVISEARYSIPALAYLSIPGGVAVTTIWDKIRAHLRFGC